MKFKVRYTAVARSDIARLVAALAERDPSAARKARKAIIDAARILEQFPFACRTAGTDDPFLRELVVPFGHYGFVALYRIENDRVVTVSSVRHQREEDYF